MFMALKRMGAFCKKVVLGFRFGRLELALIRPERKHNNKALPPYSSRGFSRFTFKTDTVSSLWRHKSFMT